MLSWCQIDHFLSCNLAWWHNSSGDRAFCTITEVKECRARLVLGWVTSLVFPFNLSKQLTLQSRLAPESGMIHRLALLCKKLCTWASSDGWVSSIFVFLGNYSLQGVRTWRGTAIFLAICRVWVGMPLSLKISWSLSLSVWKSFTLIRTVKSRKILNCLKMCQGGDRMAQLPVNSLKTKKRFLTV